MQPLTEKRYQWAMNRLREWKKSNPETYKMEFKKKVEEEEVDRLIELNTN